MTVPSGAYLTTKELEPEGMVIGYGKLDKVVE
jgi:hypothetical protein